MALAGALLALFVHPPGESWAASLLVLALCASPALVRAARRVPGVRLWAPVAGLGAVLTLTGLLAGADRDVLTLFDPETPLRLVALEAADTMAPLGWAAGGVALVLAGLAVRGSDRVLGVLAATSGVLLSGAFGVALLARSIAASTSSGVTVDRPLAATAAAVLLAGLLLVVVAARWRAMTPSRPPEAGPSRAPAAAVRWAAVAAVLVLLVGAGVWAWSWFGTTTEPTRVLVDDALAACVTATAGLPAATEGISDRDLSSIYELSCDGANSAAGPIRSLEGIERLSNLTTLDLPRNEISDLTPLAALPRLGTLTLTDNAITDISPLAGLPLFDLGLSQNPIDDLSPLAGTTTLTALGVASAQVTDVSPLAAHDALSTLDLSGNAITDVAPLAGLPSLDTLRLGHNEIVDPSPLGTVPTLLILDLFGNRITAVRGLADAPLLQELQLGANPLVDLTPLLRVSTLVNLGLDETDGTRLTGVDALRAAGVSVNGLA